ncbi:uncharacterized protein LOC132392857 [Hypanus sabinus]|uniref:uncharacterized protein LOC132392857 n=1 Tax=Hypanus sabinus TaxID=79690 RepID=UPI0028C4F468|nr:uncharacterized protein LOC132392857 [Hypanus sabinus]
MVEHWKPVPANWQERSRTSSISHCCRGSHPLQNGAQEGHGELLQQRLPICTHIYSTVMKCFERLVLARISSCLSKDLDPLQFAFACCHNRSTADAISLALLDHQDNSNTYIGLLVLDHSLTFNNIISSVLVNKLQNLGLCSFLFNSILDFRIGKTQTVHIGNNISSSLTINIGAPQGCVANSLYAHDCVARHSSNTIYKFAHDTTAVGRISDRDKETYRSEVDQLVEWCCKNNLVRNIGKTEELIVDVRNTHQSSSRDQQRKE